MEISTIMDKLFEERGTETEAARSDYMVVRDALTKLVYDEELNKALSDLLKREGE